jgi:multidrug resistance efflux pump
MQVVVRVLLTVILLIAAGLLSYDLASYYLYSPWTRDARVRANVVTVAPDVSGYVDDIRVRNNQFVHKDDVLFVIDQDRYRLALANAEAAVASTHAQDLMLRDQYQRRLKLDHGRGSRQRAPAVGNCGRQLPAGHCFARHRCSEPEAN